MECCLNVTLDDLLNFNWMNIAGPHINCSELHPHSTCIAEVIKKYMLVTKGNSSFYLVLHVIPFLLFKVRKLKNKSKRQITKEVLNLGKNYAGSLLFMSSFVAWLKAMLCLNNKVRSEIDGYTTTFASLLTSASLFFESKSRREEITFFVISRSVKGYYTYLQRRGWVDLPRPEMLCFMLVMGLLSLCYYKHPEFLKHKQILEATWGIQH